MANNTEFDNLLNRLLTSECSDINLEEFSQLHYAYINQIFGDDAVRELIKETWPRAGRLEYEAVGPADGFVVDATSIHHVYYPTQNTNEGKVCSATKGYQDIGRDKNDTLCQTYSLMSYLGVDFDKTHSRIASIEQKHSKHLSMINMYRNILSEPIFIKALNDQIITNKKNAKIWSFPVNKDDRWFFIIKSFKTTPAIIAHIQLILNIWEKYGWQYFVGKGRCLSGGGKPPSPRITRSASKRTIGGSRHKKSTLRRIKKSS